MGFWEQFCTMGTPQAQLRLPMGCSWVLVHNPFFC